MNSRIDEALRELRAADPAAGLDEAWRGSSAERIARARLGETETLATEGLPMTPRTASRRWLLAATAAVVVAAVSIGVTQFGGSGRAPDRTAGGGRFAVHGGNGGSSASLPAISGADATALAPYPAHPAAATRRLLLAVLDRVPALPGAHRVGKNPSHQLDGPGGGQADQMVSVFRWWTAPGTMNDAISYFDRHVPAGFSSTGSGSGSDHGVITQLSLSFGANLPHRVFIEPGATVQIEVARLGSGVAVGVDVQGTWLRQRSAAEEIVAPTSVVITTWTGRLGTHRVQRTFDATAAARLAGIANGLPTMIPGLAFGCPFEVGDHHADLLTFTTSKGTIRLNLSTFCQPIVNVTAEGHAQPALDAGSGALQKAVSALMNKH
jgi:hypothetical protein